MELSMKKQMEVLSWGRPAGKITLCWDASEFSGGDASVLVNPGTSNNSVIPGSKREGNYGGTQSLVLQFNISSLCLVFVLLVLSVPPPQVGNRTEPCCTAVDAC